MSPDDELKPPAKPPAAIPIKVLGITVTGPDDGFGAELFEAVNESMADQLRLIRYFSDRFGAGDTWDDLIAFLMIEFKLSSRQADALIPARVTFLFETLWEWRNAREGDLPGLRAKARAARGDLVGAPADVKALREIYPAAQVDEMLYADEAFAEALTKGGEWMDWADGRDWREPTPTATQLPAITKKKNAPDDGLNPIPEEFRSRMLTKKEAGKFLGYSVKQLGILIKSGDVVCHEVNRQRFIFDVRRFPVKDRPGIRPPS